MFIALLLLVVGVAILVFGADWLVRGASSISKKAGISPLVIGLTIVAFGTSAPELVVNMVAALNNNTDIALGNIVGSNTVNILIILGVSALITTLKVSRSTTWKEIPFALLAILAVFVMSNDVFFDGAISNVLTRSEGLVLIGFFLIFLYYTFGLAKKQTEESGAETEPVIVYSNPKAIGFTLGGLLMLFFGGDLFVKQAITLAHLAGISEMLIGLTIVAIGTSLPELATSIMAAYKGQSDIAIGNVVGSNIFNIFWILGLTSVITPVPIMAGAQFDIIVCIITTLLLFCMMFVGKRHMFERWQGGLFILFYIVYIVVIVMRG